MKKIIFLLIFILLFNSVSAICNSGQIDINSAPLTELDKLTGVGPAIAQNIIDGRPFSSLEDLINVNRIGPVTLEKIKTQNLACVKDEERINPQKTEEISDSLEETSESLEENSYETSSVSSEGETIEDNLVGTANAVQSESIINLNQEVKIEQNKQTVFESKTERIRKYSIYGFAFFLVFLIIVLLIKN